MVVEWTTRSITPRTRRPRIRGLIPSPFRSEKVTAALAGWPQEVSRKPVTAESTTSPSDSKIAFRSATVRPPWSAAKSSAVPACSGVCCWARHPVAVMGRRESKKRAVRRMWAPQGKGMLSIAHELPGTRHGWPAGTRGRNYSAAAAVSIAAACARAVSCAAMAFVTPPAPGTDDCPMTLSVSRSVRPVLVFRGRGASRRDRGERHPGGQRPHPPPPLSTMRRGGTQASVAV